MMPRARAFQRLSATTRRWTWEHIQRQRLLSSLVALDSSQRPSSRSQEFHHALPLPPHTLARARALAGTTRAYTPEARQQESKRKHFWTTQELNQKTDEMIAAMSSNRRHDVSEENCFNVLEAWMELAKEGHGLQAAIRAQTLLNHVETSNFILKTSMYDVVLQAFAVSGGFKDASQRAQALVERMLSRCRAHVVEQKDELQSPRPPEPSTKTFNIVINCWSVSGASESGHRAEAVFGLLDAWGHECQAAMAQDAQHPYRGCLANIRSLNGVLIAWSKSGQAQAPERCLAILKKSIVDSDKIEPDVTTFNAVVDTWVRSNRGREGATKAEEILKMMIHWNEDGQLNGEVVPNSRSYSLVLDAWARCETREQTGEAAKRAEDILLNMIRFYRDGINVKPNCISFTTCIAAWSRSKDPSAPENAERLFDTLIELYKETDDPDFEPVVEVGNAVIAAWARAADRIDSADRAMAALEKLKRFAEPDLVSYNTILSAYSKAGRGQNAVELLTWLETISENDRKDLLPDRISYNSVLTALAKDSNPGSTEQAEELLGKMEVIDRPGQQSVKPDKISYTTVIDAWSRSGNPGQAMRAYKLVARMVRSFEQGDINVKPDVFVFAVLMKTCTRVKGTQADRHKALKMAFDAMKVLETSDFGPPNEVAFLALVRAVNRLTANESDRAKLASSVFQRCAVGGYLSTQVLAELQGAGPKRAVGPLEQSWIRNVPPNDRPVLNR